MIIRNEKVGKKYKCPYCGDLFNKRSLKEHFYSHFKSKEDGNSFLLNYFICDATCAWCNEKITTYRVLKPSYGDFYTGDNGKLCCSKKCSRSLTNRSRYNADPEKYKEILKKQSDAQRGLTYEERYGEERAKEIKSKCVHYGESNGMFGKSRPEFGNYGKKNKGKTIDEIYGKTKADIIRSKLSEHSSGKKNPMFGVPSPMGSGNGWSGWYRGNFFRSILELSAMVYFEKREIEYQSAERKEYGVRYLDKDGNDRTYFPDFVGNGIDIYEIKPKKLTKSEDNILKFNAAISKYGNRFIILTEEEVEKLSAGDILALEEFGHLTWMDRYKDKVTEWRKNESNN